MIAALIYSQSPCEGPTLNRRGFQNARVVGATEEDRIEIGPLVCCGEGLLDISSLGDRISVNHVEASGEPVSVEIF